MKILILNKHPHDVVGGSEIQCDFIARGLLRRGHDVVYGALAGQQSRYEVPYDCSPLPARNPAALRELLERVRPDLVYWRHNLKGFLGSAREISRLGSALVFAVSHESDVQRFPKRARLKKPFEVFRHFVNYHGHRFVDGVASQNAELLGCVPAPRQAHLRNLMTDRCEPFSWPRDYVVWVSNLKPRKKPERFVELAQRLQSRTGPLRLAKK